MSVEQFANNATTTVGGSGISSSDVSLTVASATGFPTGGNFRIKIDSELIQVTGVSGTTFTIVRGDGGTSAASHSSGTLIYCIVTKEALESIVTTNSAGSFISARRCLNFVSGATIADNAGTDATDITIAGGGIPWEDSITVPVLSNFAWVNQGTAIGQTTSKNAIFIKAYAASGNNAKMLGVSPPTSSVSSTLSSSMTSGQTTAVLVSVSGFPAVFPFYILIDSEILEVLSVASTTFTVRRGVAGTSAASHSSSATVSSSSWTAIMRMTPLIMNVAYHSAGFIIYDSGSSKLLAFTLSQNIFSIIRYTSVTSYSATPFTITGSIGVHYAWMKFVYINGDVIWFHSQDGESWVAITTYSFTSWTSNTSKIGFFVESNNATYDAGILLESWAATSP